MDGEILNYFQAMGQPPPPQRLTAYAPHETPPARPGRAWGAAAIGVVVGLLLAVAAGAVLVGTKTLHLGSTTATAPQVGTAPITLPADLVGFQDLIDVTKSKVNTGSTGSATIVAAQQKNQQKVAAATIAAYQRAVPGAAVGYRAYADAGLLQFAGVIAVRAQYAGLTSGPVPDPVYQGLAVAQQQVKIFGDVQCSVSQSRPTPTGTPVDPALDLTTMCQRTGPGLTVQVYGTGFKGAAGQQQLVMLTNAGWASVTG